MKKITLLITAILLSFSLLSTSAFAKNPLVGNWSNGKIKLNIKANHKYTYTVKILGVKKTFVGRWSTKGKTLTLNYTLLGKRKKTATYSFNKGNLLLKQNGKTSRLKKRQGLGRKRTDILVEWPLDKEKGFFGEKIQRVVIETKLLYSNIEETIQKGCEQTLEYADIVGVDECHLIIFRDKAVDWTSKIWHQQHEQNG